MNSRADINADKRLIFGNRFDGDATPIREITGETGPIIIEGEVFSYEKKDIKNGKAIVLIALTDHTDSIKVKIFADQREISSLSDNARIGSLLKVKGSAIIDSFDDELYLQRVIGIQCSPSKRVRTDKAPQKRVELHCHTNMSDMDGVSDIRDIMERAAKWGHKGIAITDHGVVQSFASAYDNLSKVRKDNPDFKVIYGLEGYLVDDLAGTVVNSKSQTFDGSFVVFDIETTGFSPVKNSITEIGAVKIIRGEIADRFSTFVNPGEHIPEKITQLTSITDEMVKDAPSISSVLPKFLDFCKDSVLVAHNASFDMSFIKQKAMDLGIELDVTYVDTLAMSRAQLVNLGRFTLDSVARALNVALNNHHRAVDDAECTAHVFLKLVEMLNTQGIKDLDALQEFGKRSPDVIIKSRTSHVTILVKNEVGRVNLYRLVSESHINYFYRHPRIPKSLLAKYREGLVIGSACSQGEVYRAILDDWSEQSLVDLASFYDYLEIQPIENNEFMIGDDRYENVNSKEDLISINRKILALGERINKPVVATGDVHFLNPEDEIYRDILIDSAGAWDTSDISSLYFHTTEEMLEAFSYLSPEKAYEVVVTNTNRVADMIQDIAPVRPDKCPPVIDNSDEMLKELCYSKAHELYGVVLPEIVKKRLETELESIIGNGYSVLYIIGQQLVRKSLQEGYLVGSRGSVGSSFAAYTAGITEVNPLPPHYLCPECKYSDFDSDKVREFHGLSGYDMPDENCPICGAPLKKAGFGIPFEVFLGFEGDKEPDIDLNFASVIQSSIHKFTEEIFGHGNCFKAGTISTLAEKTAYGFVKKYLEKKGVTKRRAEIERLALGCLGVKRGTGQHPGGIIVLPKGEDINSFTPIQYPANDSDSPFITTHFDYHSIDHNLLKFDLLGHDDPTMLKSLKDYTGLDPEDVPFDDPKVMSLFRNTEVLGISPQQIGGTRVGCLGIPEFGTDFAMSMVLDAKPESFSDLVRLAGLAHGTDVWLGNAKDLIEKGIATLSSCICCRDDIMTFLIEKGLDKHMAFEIMEDVRKGKVAKGKSPHWNEWEQEMQTHNVAEWYIDSCKKINYMFPKAHAAAYVMMAWRIAYYKIYYPQAFYAAWFTIRAKTLNYEKMFQEPDILKSSIESYRAKAYLTSSEKEEYTALRVAEEMYARGIEVEPIDLMRVDPAKFIIDGEKVMPSLVSIGRLGEKAAMQIVDAAREKEFSSVDDFKCRTKCPQTVLDNMMELGLLKGIPNPKQMSLFDYLGEPHD